MSDAELYKQFLAEKNAPASTPSDAELYKQFLSEKNSGPGAADSAVRQFVQGGTMGASDEAMGGISAAERMVGLKRPLTGPIYKNGEWFPESGLARDKNGDWSGPTIDIDELTKAYRGGRDTERADMVMDKKTNPGTSGTADLIGSIMSPANKIMPQGFVKSGIVNGAMGGLGRSDAESFSGNIKDTIESAGLGGAIGAGTAGLGAGIKWAAPKVGSAVSGIREDVIKKARDILPELQMARQNPAIALSKIEQGKASVVGALSKAKQSVWGGIKKATQDLDQAGEQIPTDKIMAPMRDLVTELRTGPHSSDANKATADELQKMIEQHLSVPVKKMIDGQEITEYVLPEMINSTHADKLYREMKKLTDAAGVDYGKFGTARSILSGASDPEVASALNQGMVNAKTGIRDLATKYDQKIADQIIGGNAQYSGLKELEDNIFNVTKNPKAFDQFLRRNDTVSKGLKAKIAQTTGQDVNKIGDEVQAYNMFAQPNWASKSLDGATSTSRTIPLAAGGAALGGYLGYTNGGVGGGVAGTAAGAGLGAGLGSTAMLMKMMQLGQLGKHIPKNIPMNVYLHMKTNEEK